MELPGVLRASAVPTREQEARVPSVRRGAASLLAHGAAAWVQPMPRERVVPTQQGCVRVPRLQSTRGRPLLQAPDTPLRLQTVLRQRHLPSRETSASLPELLRLQRVRARQTANVVLALFWLGDLPARRGANGLQSVQRFRRVWPRAAFAELYQLRRSENLPPQSATLPVPKVRWSGNLRAQRAAHPVPSVRVAASVLMPLTDGWASASILTRQVRCPELSVWTPPPCTLDIGCAFFFLPAR